MNENKQYVVLDKSHFATVVKALQAGDWTIENADTQYDEQFASSSSQITLAYSDNEENDTQIQDRCGSLIENEEVDIDSFSPNTKTKDATGTKIKNSTEEFLNSKKKKSYVKNEKDYPHVITLTELGKKLSSAVKNSDINAVKALIGIGAPFSPEGTIGMTPLHLAVQNGHYEMCEILLGAGISKDAVNKVDKTPLHFAAMLGHADIVKLLVSENAPVNMKDLIHMTPLHWACDRGHKDVVKILLKHNANTNLVNKFNQTASQIALDNEFYEIAKLVQDGLDSEDDMSLFDKMDSNIILDDVPDACNTEEVCTEEIEDCDEEEYNLDEDSDAPNEDSSKCILASLDELTKVTSEDQDGGETIEMSNSDALELLKAQAALLPADDSSALITSVIAHGQTIQLTEAGEQALNLMKRERFLIPESSVHNINAEDLDLEEAESERNNRIMAKRKKLDIERTNHTQITRVIEVSPETYAALTDSSSKDIVLEVVVDENNDICTQTISSPALKVFKS